MCHQHLVARFFLCKFKLGSNGKFVIGVKVSLIKKKPANKV